MTFDHERLDVYQAALEFAARAFELCKRLPPAHRHAREQLLRSSQSVPQNIAEGNGKRSLADRRRFFEIARGSALESASSLDVLAACGAITDQEAKEGKKILHRVVSMLTRMTERGPVVRDDSATYANRSDYDYEHEHEHEWETGQRRI
jgi:four helix bundle protein